MSFQHRKALRTASAQRRAALCGAFVSLAALCLALPGGPAIAQPSSAAVAATPSVKVLSVELDRANALRSVKRLAYAYSQFGEYGLWSDMADLFSATGEIVLGNRTFRGHDAILEYLTKEYGNGQAGLPVGSINTQLMMAPVVNLAADGKTARGRWQELTMRGAYGGAANWSGGLQVNDYVNEGGVWKIQRMVVHAQLAGSYEEGWRTPVTPLPFIDYHYTTDEAGAPVPALTPAMIQAIDRSAASISLADVEHRVAAMNDEDEVRNLQNIYGYYQDRKMWDDVTDLFTPDAVFEIAGLGVYKGTAGVRRAMERNGPAGLQRGQVNDQMMLNSIVEIAPNGVEARARGLQVGIITPKLGEAYWQTSNYENHYVKIDGKWRIREMRIYPKMYSDYYQGWHKSRIIEPVPIGKLAPDRPSPAANSPQTSAVIPAFLNNPVTGRPVAYPAGFRIVGDDRLLPALKLPAASAKTGDEAARIVAAEKAGDRSLTWDAVENISSAWQYAFDDFQFQRYAEVYAERGWRKKANGTIWEGRNAIFKGEALSYGPMDIYRDWVRSHTRLQPVILVSDNGEEARMRTRMLIYSSTARGAGSFNSGMYHDYAVRERGVWKWAIGGWIDETYWNSRGYKLGWAKPNEPLTEGQGSSRAAVVPPRDPGLAERREALSYPSDIDSLGPRAAGIVNGAPGFAAWPDIKPMWFEYKNPISGRVPEYYCENAKVCVPPQAPTPATGQGRRGPRGPRGPGGGE